MAALRSGFRRLFSSFSLNLPPPANPPPKADPSTNLFISGLSKRTTTDGLREAFAKFGEIVHARVITDRVSGYSKGFGFVRYASIEEAAEGIKGMDGKFLDGWVIFAEYAKPRESPPPPPQTQIPATNFSYQPTDYQNAQSGYSSTRYDGQESGYQVQSEPQPQAPPLQSGYQASSYQESQSGFYSSTSPGSGYQTSGYGGSQSSYQSSGYQAPPSGFQPAYQGNQSGYQPYYQEHQGGGQDTQPGYQSQGYQVPQSGNQGPHSWHSGYQEGQSGQQVPQHGYPGQQPGYHGQQSVYQASGYPDSQPGRQPVEFEAAESVSGCVAQP